ncbi:hypothetical protein HanRHA438_Chr07g0302281 [Helianthus annuus]|nr:hypothetical protein HanRHA438_Chr07g0302281 [Helianthus annuus]
MKMPHVVYLKTFVFKPFTNLVNKRNKIIIQHVKTYKTLINLRIQNPWPGIVPGNCLAPGHSAARAAKQITFLPMIVGSYFRKQNPVTTTSACSTVSTLGANQPRHRKGHIFTRYVGFRKCIHAVELYFNDADSHKNKTRKVTSACRKFAGKVASLAGSRV